jgi:hypothetical protein
LGLFMIFNLLEKETALFDAEQRLRISLAEENTPGSRRAGQTHGKASLAAASAH